MKRLRKTWGFGVALLLLIPALTQAGPKETPVKIESNSGTLHGSLLLPDTTNTVPVVLIIAGSGPTDRDGNGPGMINNSLKLLANGLASHNIASLRFDKRGVGKSAGALGAEKDLRFDHYIDDVGAWIRFLKTDTRFDHVFVIGHSEGSLLGMVAIQKHPVSGYVSLAGSGRPAATLLQEQLQSQPDTIRTEADSILDQLLAGKTVPSISPGLHALFRPSVQPYLISWFAYDPRQEIAKIHAPILIAQGKTDLQVSLKDADALARANPKAKRLTLPKMNHVLKQAPINRAENLHTYTDPKLPLAPGLITGTRDFVLHHSL